MSIESYSVGARVDTPFQDAPLNVSADATWKANMGALDSVRVLVGLGDTRAPKGVESKTQQAMTMADGSVRQIELPRISAERRADDNSTRTSLGVTVTGASAELLASPALKVQPSATVAVGSNGKDSAVTARATLGWPKFDTNVTLGKEGIGAAKTQPPNDLNRNALKDNNDALRGAVIVRP
jgi:hypothetical protein